MMPKQILQFYLMFALVYFGQGIGGLGGLSIFFEFKNTFGLDVQEIAIIGLLTSIFWWIKPLFGLISDVLPIKGQHRRPYLIMAYLAIVASYGYLIAAPLTIINYIIAAMVTSCCFCMADVVTDGTTAEVSKKLNIQGAAQSVQWGSLNVASVITGICGGLIATYFDYRFAYSILMIIFSCILFSVLFSYKEEPSPKKSIDLSGIKTAIKLKSLWVAAVFLFCLYFSPSFGTALSFRMVDVLGFSKLFMGTLGSIGAFASICGAGIYYFYSKKFNFKNLLFWSIIISSVITLAYLFYNSAIIAIIYAIIFGFIGMILQLIMLEFVTRSVPDKAEAFTFAAMCSFINFGSNGSDVLGSWLYKIIGFEWLVVVSASTTMLCLIFIPFLNLTEDKSM